MSALTLHPPVDVCVNCLLSLMDVYVNFSSPPGGVGREGGRSCGREGGRELLFAILSNVLLAQSGAPINPQAYFPAIPAKCQDL